MSPGRRAARWGTAGVVAAVAVVLIGTGVLARSLPEPVALPVLPPSPEAATPPPTLEGTRGDIPGGAPRQAAAPERSPRQAEPEPEPEPEPESEPEPLPDACQVQIEVLRWQGAFRASYTVTNQGEPWDGWTATFQVNDGVAHEFGWDAFFSQQGTTITASNAPWNSSVGTGESVAFGHRGSRPGGPVGIAGFAVNGTTCTVA